MLKFNYIITLSLMLSCSIFAQNNTDSSLGEKGDALIKQNKFTEAIDVYDKAISELTGASAEEILKRRKLLISKGWALFRIGKRDESNKLLKQRYEMMAKAAEDYPENLEIAKAQINDLGAIARKMNIRKESDQRIALQLKAEALADALVAKDPDEQALSLIQYNTKYNLAKSYRWNNETRLKVPDLVKQGLEILSNIDQKSLPSGLPKEYLRLQLVQLQIGVLTLDKKYADALELSSDLLEKTKPLLMEGEVESYQISLLGAVMYHHAVLHEKMGKPKDAQFHLKNLLKAYQVGLARFPNDATLIADKKRYEAWLGKELK